MDVRKSGKATHLSAVFRMSSTFCSVVLVVVVVVPVVVLCGDEDAVRVSWLGRFTHVLVRGWQLLWWFGVFWLLFCLVVWSVAVLLCVAVLCLVFVCCLFLCFFGLLLLFSDHRVSFRWIKEISFGLLLTSLA